MLSAAAKRKLRALEDAYAEQHGRRPNIDDRLACDQMRRYTEEIRDLKRDIRCTDGIFGIFLEIGLCV